MAFGFHVYGALLAGPSVPYASYACHVLATSRRP